MAGEQHAQHSHGMRGTYDTSRVVFTTHIIHTALCMSVSIIHTVLCVSVSTVTAKARTREPQHCERLYAGGGRAQRVLHEYLLVDDLHLFRRGSNPLFTRRREGRAAARP